MSRPVRLLSWLAAAFSVAYLAHLAMQAGAALRPETWSGPQWWALGRAVALYLAAVLLTAAAWHFQLGAAGTAPTARLSLGVFLTSHPARYLPGNVAHYIGRVVLARHAGLPTAAVVASLLAETAGTVVVGAVVAAVTLRDEPLPALPGPGWFLPAGMAAVVVAAALLFGRRAARTAEEPASPRRAGRIVLCGGLYLAVFCAHGAAAATLARALYGDSPLGLLTGCFALAWLAGFLTPGVPAGIGVREAVFAALVAPRLGPAAAVGLPLMMRLVTILGDALTLPVGLALHRRRGPLAPG